MFKNPLKYQEGGKANKASQEQLVQLFQAAAENAQVDPQELVQKASEIGDNEEAAAQFMQGLQLCAQGDPEGIKFIKSLFQQPAYKKGGKILDFICKYARGGYVAGCSCKKQEGGAIKPGFEYLGEYAEQDANNPNQWNIVAHGYNINGRNIAKPTGQGGFWMGNEKGAGYDNGKKVYSPEQMDNWTRFYEEVLPVANRVQGPKERLAGMECGGKVKKAEDGTQFKAPTNYYNEKGWQISKNNALRRNNRTFYTEEPTTAGNLAWTNNQMSNQLMWPGVVQDVQYNQPVGHYIDEDGNMHNFAIERDDLVRYNNRKAQWKASGGKVEKAADFNALENWRNYYRSRNKNK